MTRKIKFIIATLFTTGLLFLFPSNRAYADEIVATVTTSQPIPDLPTNIVDTSTVTVQAIQAKIDAAVSSLQITSQANGNATITTIQTNVSNTDTATAISIATSQEPIATAFADATAKIKIAQQTIDSATVATQVAQTSIITVDTQTMVVAQAQAAVDTATVTTNNAQTNLTSEVAKLPDLKDTQRTTESGFYIENSNLGTATSNVQIAQDNLTNAVTDLQNNGTITTTTNGVTATVYRATNGAAPSISNSTPILTTTVPNIAFNWGSGVVLNSGLSDHVIIKFDGTIAVPSDATAVKYAIYSDDGSKLYVNGTLAINNWRDQGLTWSGYSPTYSVTGGQTQQLTIWYYENGGGAGVTLGWGITKSDGTGYFTTPGSSAFGTTTTTVDPVKLAAADAAKANVISTQSAYNTQLAVRDAAYQAWQDAIHAVNAQQSFIDAAQAAYDTAQQNLTIAQQNLTTEQQNLTIAQQTSQSALQTANSLADSATVSVQDANTATENAVAVTKDYYAKIAADKAMADKLAAEAAARAQAIADAKAQADAQAAAEAAAKALADQQAAEAAKALADQQAAEAKVAADKAAADAIAAQQAADAKVAQDTTDAKAKAEQDAANAKAEADKKAAEQAAADKAVQDKAIADAKAAQDAANVKAEADKTAAEAAAKDQAAKAEADKLAAQQAADKKAAEDKTSADKAAVAKIGVVSNNPTQLPTDVPKPAPAEVLVPHIQVDVKGVENGGIQFFGTQSAPQVVGEDGHLTPPAPPPGSGLPIPADAITTADTFIGQPGGASFNAPDVAVPVFLTPVTGALAAVPGVQAINQAFVAMANIGNDMSPVTRKKAKKILVTTVVVGQIVALRRRFGK